MTDTTNTTEAPRGRRGFAAMDPDRRREIARKGGASVPKAKRSFSQSRELASLAGTKGGKTSRRTATPQT